MRKKKIINFCVKRLNLITVHFKIPKPFPFLKKKKLFDI